MKYHHNPLHPDVATQQGYTIDTSCYPWFAYKGPRFAPTDRRDCYTDLESELLREQESQGIK